MSTVFDFTRHNEEVRQVWESYNAGRPIRVPVPVEDRTAYAIRISRIEPDAQELQLQRAVSHLRGSGAVDGHRARVKSSLRKSRHEHRASQSKPCLH